MKKMISVFAGIFFLVPAFSQTSVKFSMGLKPATMYSQLIIQKIKMKISLDSSSADVIARMDSNGMKNPTIQEQNTEIAGTMQTGALNSRTSKMPVTMTLHSSDPKLAQVFTPSTHFFGTAQLNKLPVYDSISGVGMNKQQKEQMLKTMSVLTQIQLPVKSMKVGDYDTLHSPVSIPVAGVSMKMDYVTIFHLKSIEGNTAFFDTQAEFRLDMEVKDLPITGSGSGAGIMEYDLINHYPTKNTLSYILHMGISKDELVMHIDMDASMENTCKIQSL